MKKICRKSATKLMTKKKSSLINNEISYKKFFIAKLVTKNFHRKIRDLQNYYRKICCNLATNIKIYCKIYHEFKICCKIYYEIEICGKIYNEKNIGGKFCHEFGNLSQKSW